jgi:hypothetical protein
MRPNPDAAGLNCDHATHICVGTIAISSPTATTYTNKAVAIQVTATPADDPPAEVQILRDGATLVSVPPPFSYTWETASETEGPHQISAAAAVGSKTITAGSVTVIVDRTPPSLIDRTPAPNATNVALIEPITLVFSEALDPSSVTDAVVTLSSGGTTLSTTASLGSDGKTITVALTSHAGLVFPATITAAVNGAIKDLAGNQLVSVASWSWTAPLWVKLPTVAGYAPTVALDPGGKPAVAFLTNAANLTVARYAAGAVWDLTTGAPTANTASAASVAVDSSGALVVGWSDSHINVSRWGGTAWVALGGYADATAPTADSVSLSSMILDSSGTPFVGWNGFTGPNHPGYVGQLTGSSWALLPAGASAGPGGPILRLESDGTPVGLFPGSLGVSPALARYASGSWTTIDSSSEVSAPLDFAINTQDQPVIIVAATESNVATIHVRVHGGAGWTDQVTALSTGSTAAVGAANLRLDSMGNPLVLWSQTGSSNAASLRLARFNGTAWDTTYGTLNGVTGGNGVQYFNFAADSQAVPTVAWSQQDPSTTTSSVYVWKGNY